VRPADLALRLGVRPADLALRLGVRPADLAVRLPVERVGEQSRGRYPGAPAEWGALVVMLLPQANALKVQSLPRILTYA
jgi:hypothetical protein